jgi:hypothetical protein
MHRCPAPYAVHLRSASESQTERRMKASQRNGGPSHHLPQTTNIPSSSDRQLRAGDIVSSCATGSAVSIPPSRSTRPKMLPEADLSPHRDCLPKPNRIHTACDADSFSPRRKAEYQVPNLAHRQLHVSKYLPRLPSFLSERTMQLPTAFGLLV